MNTNKLLPCDYNAEACVLSAVINEPESVVTFINDTQDAYFYKSAHRIIAEAIRYLFLEDLEIDVVMLIKILKENKKLEKVGGALYLNELSDVVISAANIESHVKIIKDMFLLRSLIVTVRAIDNECMETSKPVNQIIERAQAAVLAVSSDGKRPYKNMREIASELMDKKEKILKGEIIQEKYLTGIVPLDRTVDLHKGKLLIIGAKKSVGKSVFANVLGFMNARSYGRKVGIFNMEMTSHEIAERELARSGRLTLDQVLHPNHNDIDRLMAELNEIQNASVLVDDSGGQSLPQIRAISMRMKHELGGLDLIIVDYLQLMTPPKAEKRHEQIAALSRGLKKLAKDLNILVVALTQLNKVGEARESKAIEQDADIFIKIVRPKFEDRTVERIIVNGGNVDVNSKLYSLMICDKNRMGKTGVYEGWLVGEHQRFEEYTGQEDNNDRY